MKLGAGRFGPIGIGAVALFACTGASMHSQSELGNAQYYWDKPETEWFWVPKGTEGSTIVKMAMACGARIDGSIANHGIVPPGYDVGVFKFVEPSSVAARQCTVSRLGAVPALTTYMRAP